MISGRFHLTGLLFFTLFIFLLLIPATTFSHEIHLKNGKIIKTNAIKKTKNNIQYELYGGTITIKLSDVKKITQQNQNTTDTQDLAVFLADKLHPKTPVENANLATLSVKTHAGSGSGFFISDQGFIITNRHVVRGSEKQFAAVSAKLKEADRDIETVQIQFAHEKKKISTFEKQIQNKRQEINVYSKHTTTKY